MALARADLVRDRAENSPDLKPDPPPPSIDDVKDFAASIPLEPVPLLKFVGLFFLRMVSWFGIPPS